MAAPVPASRRNAPAPAAPPVNPYLATPGFGVGGLGYTGAVPTPTATPSSADAQLLAGAVKGSAINVAGKVLTPVMLAKQGFDSLRAGRPVGVYKDLWDAAVKVSGDPSAATGMVMNALQQSLTEATSSPEAFGEYLGGGIDPTTAITSKNPLLQKIFAGERSATWDQTRADAARQLETSGTVSPEDIWRQTGTWRGPDKSLRQEIDDSGARFFVPNMTRNNTFTGKMEDVLSHPDLYAAYPWMKDLTIKFDPNLRSLGSADPRTGIIEIRSDLLSNPDAVKSTILHELQHGVQAFEHFAPGGNPGIAKRLADAANARDVMPVHPQKAQYDLLQRQLQQKHAELNNSDWMKRPIDQLNAYGAGGRLIRPADFLDSISGKPIEYWRNYGDEIMQKVGRPPNAAKYPQAYSKWAQKAGQELVAVIRQKGPSIDSSKIQGEINLLGSQLNQLRNSPEFMRNQQKFNDWLDRQNVSGKNTFQLYQALGGEAESRAVQARMNFLLSQRQNTFPGASYDIRPELTYNALYTDLFNVPPGTIPTSARP